MFMFSKDRGINFRVAPTTHLGGVNIFATPYDGHLTNNVIACLYLKKKNNN